MRKLLGLLLCFGLCTMLGLGSVGCSKKKEKEKDGVAKKEKPGTDGGTKKEPKITLTVADVTIEKDKGIVKVEAARENYDGDIELAFGEVKGVEFAKDAKIKSGEKSADVAVTVDKEKAKAGDQEVTVKGKGGKATHEAKFTLTIKGKGAAKETKKAKITLSADDVAIKLDKDKKGKGTAKITATRENYDGAIKLTFKAPKGVTIKNAAIAEGEKSADVDVTVEGADAGDAEVTVTGTGGEATADTKLKVKIAAK